MQAGTNKGVTTHCVINQATVNQGMFFDCSRNRGVEFPIRPPPGLPAPFARGPPPRSIMFADFVGAAQEQLASALATRDHVEVANLAQRLVEVLHLYNESQDDKLHVDTTLPHINEPYKAQKPSVMDGHGEIFSDEVFSPETIPQPSPGREVVPMRAFCTQTICMGERAQSKAWPQQTSRMQTQAPQVLCCDGAFCSESMDSISTCAPTSRQCSKSSAGSSSIGLFPHQLVDEFGIEVPSIGSLNHHSGRCRPCDFVSRSGSCRAGTECSFCHICGPTENRRRKKIRQKLIRGAKSAPCKGDALDMDAFWSTSSSLSSDTLVEL